MLLFKLKYMICKKHALPYDNFSLQSMSLATSCWILSSLDDKLMSINSDSVYIWRPPIIDGSYLNSSWNSLP